MGDVKTSESSTKVDVRLPGKGNSNSHGARPVHLIITMVQWIRSRLSIKNSLSLDGDLGARLTEDECGIAHEEAPEA